MVPFTVEEATAHLHQVCDALDKAGASVLVLQLVNQAGSAPSAAQIQSCRDALAAVVHATRDFGERRHEVAELLETSDNVQTAAQLTIAAGKSFGVRAHALANDAPERFYEDFTALGLAALADYWDRPEPKETR